MEHHENNGFPRTPIISLMCKLYGNQESAVKTGAGIRSVVQSRMGCETGVNSIT